MNSWNFAKNNKIPVIQRVYQNDNTQEVTEGDFLMSLLDQPFLM